MQAYGDAFARIYNARWGGFAQRVAPRILEFYTHAATDASQHPILDLCCGTGQLARYFLAQGYSVIGLDLSAAMLHYARENVRPYIEGGQAQFIQGDAADFSLDMDVGLVVSTYDALNHLADLSTLTSCFRATYAVLVPGGWFIFDLNTALGLRSHWLGIQVQDTEDLMLITRGVMVAEMQRVYTRISGFARLDNGLYERFEQTAFNTMFSLDTVRDALLETGFHNVTFAAPDDLTAPIATPEQAPRVFITAQK